MKIKCIDNDDYWLNLTIDKIYEVIAESSSGYKIINDLGEENWYRKEWFKTISEMRNDKINRLLEDENKMYR